jgi:hypothetical protein
MEQNQWLLDKRQLKEYCGGIASEALKGPLEYQASVQDFQQ